MLSLDKINPLNVLECREVLIPPLHFHYLTLNLKYSVVGVVKEWIWENLKHRFYFGECLCLENNHFCVRVKIGFENSKEASFFLLACSLLNDPN